MKKLLLTTILAIGCASAFAQKTVYIPVEWRYFNSNDTLLYADNDPENKYTWSKSRSIETDNFIVFWDKYWGNTPPDKLNSSNFYYIDLKTDGVVRDIYDPGDLAQIIDDPDPRAFVHDDTVNMP